MKDRYVLVSPCKDEEQYIERTLESVRRQTIRPVQWVIVDDGSTDNSVEIIKKHQEDMPYIKLVRRKASERNVGGGVIMAFNEGREAIDVHYDFICKFDVDLVLPERYFEILMRRMDADPQLGTCSGKAYYLHPKNGRLISEMCGDEASVGMTKFYRRACFEKIGGFVADVGWDGFDCHSARWHGWRAASWDEPDLNFLHLRPMGSSQKSVFQGRIRHGRGQYLLGAHPLFFLASSLLRSVKQRPYIIGTFYSIYGYCQAWIIGEKRFGDQDVTRFIQAYQLRALIKGKRKAAEWALQKRVAPPGSAIGRN